MSEPRVTYRFGPLERRGILGPVRPGQAAMLALGGLLAIVVLDQSPSTSGALIAILLFGAAVGLAVAPLGNRTMEEWAPIAAAFAVRYARRPNGSRGAGGFEWNTGPGCPGRGRPGGERAAGRLRDIERFRAG